ncbi:MAG: hypothetical protein O3B01_15290 [Planctomycetota bacterium]|nr:hypothetical protein [Planctomycetota bacterium]
MNRKTLIAQCAATVLFLLPSLQIQANDIGFIEKFALARDRSEPLKQLIPGTEDYYYYHCLHLQHQSKFDEVEALLAQWIKRYQYTGRVEEIRNRQALLQYDKDSTKTLDFIKQRLGLRFDQQKRVMQGQAAKMPSVFDQNLISRARLTKDAFRRHQNNLAGFEESALDFLVTADLNADIRRDLLRRLRRPDYDNLVALVDADLKYQHSRGFGSHGIHVNMLLEQLEELGRLNPALMNNANYINAVMTKLQPGPDEDWTHDEETRGAYLLRLWNFVGKLPPSQNSLKANILYQRLVFDESLGNYDKQRFVEYLKLPRPVHYIRPEYLNLEENRRDRVNLHANYQSITWLPPISDDEQLVGRYLDRFLVQAPDTKEFEIYFREDYLKEAFATTKILNGIGDMEQWYSMLPPARYQALKERVDIEFPPTNKNLFRADEKVSLALYIKNVSSLIVKVYELNPYNYYRDQGQEIGTDIDLDGLVANEEKVHKYDEIELRRVARNFEFPSLKNRGLFVVEFIGNGKSSRAVIRKGRLNYIETTTSAGHSFKVLDDDNKVLKEASIWLSGHDYWADEDGAINVPFTNSPGRQAIILSAGGPKAKAAERFSILDSFNHQAEQYVLVAGIHVDRESLVKRKNTKVIVRPALYANGRPVSLSILEEVTLEIESVDRQNVSTKKDIHDFKLFEDRESIYEFQVPDELTQLSFTLKAKVKNLSGNRKDDKAVRALYTLNQIDSTDKVEDLHFTLVDGNYHVRVLGKSGEPRADQPVYLTFKPKHFTNPVNTVLQTDVSGSVFLGPLPDIHYVQARGGQGTIKTCYPLTATRTYPSTIHSKAETPISVPFMGSADAKIADEFSLLQKRGNTYHSRWFSKLGLKDGFLQIGGLPPGDYELYIKEPNLSIGLRVAAGIEENDWLLSQVRALEVNDRKPLQITGIEARDDLIRVSLTNASKFTRVHVSATRFVPEFGAYQSFASVSAPEARYGSIMRAPSQYVSGRKIGDEFRYIIERKYAKKFPGNMLPRPEILLNPWSVRTTDTGEQLAQQGEQWKREPEQQMRQLLLQNGKGEGRGNGVGDSTTSFTNLDFVGEPALFLTNLRPEKGIVSIDRKELGDRQHLRIYAVDPENTVFRELALKQDAPKFADLRLSRGFDPKKPFTEQKKVSTLKTGEKFVLKDITTSKFEIYDSLPKVYSLLSTLSGNSTLREFLFINNWPHLKPEEKQENYSKYACHELNFFIYKRDPDFFKKVIQPFLKNKKDKTFLDRWLVGENLDAYLDAWKFSQLNMVERILLGQTLRKRQASLARHVKENFDMTPPDVERFNQLFETAIKGSAFETGDKYGFVSASREMLLKAALPGAALPPMDAPALAIARDGADKNENLRAANAQLADRKEMAAAPAAKKAKDSLALRERAQKADAEGEGDADAAFYRSEEKGRSQARQFYRKLEKTSEWAENNYYKLTIHQQTADLVKVNGFWNDYAAFKGEGEFLSTQFPQVTSNFTEMMFALSVLDLPFESKEHKVTFDGPEMNLIGGNPSVVFHKEILEAKEAEEKTPILVSQNFFENSDRYRHVNNERLDKYVTEEFLIHTVYGCQIVITNPTSSRQKLDILLQIPHGSVPVMNGFYTRSFHWELQPYSTRTFDYHFYFPAPGDYLLFPVHVAKNEALIARGQDRTMKVVREPTKQDTASWEFISQNSSNDEVIKYLSENNLNRINLDDIAFRMRDKAFFTQTIDLLKDRLAYNNTLWSFGVSHNDVNTIREYLKYNNQFVQQTGGTIDCELVTFDPVERKTYEHLEYKPLVNARAHQLGGERKILNSSFFQQYQRLMKTLTYSPKQDDNDLLAVSYYLLLQDRVEEATETFARVNRVEVEEDLQYDYLQAYLAMHQGKLDDAAAISRKYASHPVDRWRNRFAEIKDHTDEIKGEGPKIRDDEDRSQQQTKLAATEPGFDFTVEARKVNLNYQNVKDCLVNFYRMDVELLFSKNPFVQQHAGHFAYIRPNATQTFKLPEGKTMLSFDLPKEFHNQNVMVEVQAGGIRKSLPYFSNSIALQIIENYGHLKIAHQETGKPLKGVYVKVYAQLNDGEHRFYKDGYTDLRGRFDFTSLNTNLIDQVSRFSMLVLSDDDGAIVREADKPKM